MAIITTIATVGSIAGKASKLFGGGQKTGAAWNRLQPIKVGESLEPNRSAVDAKFANTINAAWRGDLARNDFAAVKGRTIIWGPVGIETYRQARRGAGLAAAATVSPISLGALGTSLGKPGAWLLIGAVAIGGILLVMSMRKSK